MTSNQKQALQLAEAVLNRHVEPSGLSDEQWQLLLLASGMNYCRSNAAAICTRTIDDFLKSEGYFSNCTPPRPFAALNPSGAWDRRTTEVRRVG